MELSNYLYQYYGWPDIVVECLEAILGRPLGCSLQEFDAALRLVKKHKKEGR